MRKFLFFFVLLFSLTFVLAAPPFQTFDRDTGITIESSIIETRQVDQDFFFNIHVHNSSNGLLLNNESANCTIHIFRPSDGFHILEQLMGFDVNGIDFDILVASGNFTELGQYSVLFNCQVAGDIGGFLEYGFDVTNSGMDLSLWDSLVRIFLIIFFIVLLISTHHVASDIDFKKWNDRIVEKYKTRNFVKMTLSMIFYNIMKNIFIIYYLMGLPIILILNDLTHVYNIVGMILFVQVVLYIYIIGIIIVGIIFLSYVQEWAVEMLDLVRDMDWGIEK